jgi:hypothetical protein
MGDPNSARPWFDKAKAADPKMEPMINQKLSAPPLTPAPVQN